MNHIQISYVKTCYKYLEWYWEIDGEILVQYLENSVTKEKRSLAGMSGSFLGLMPAWTGELECKPDNVFIWGLIDANETLNVPVLVCEDDCDLSCIILLVHIRKEGKWIYWDKIGILKRDNWDKEKEQESGILCLEQYTDEDWEKYGDNIATETFGTREYWDWYADNWEEEIKRQRMNYMKPYMQKEENIEWLLNTNWVFDKEEYEVMVEEYRKQYQKNMNSQEYTIFYGKVEGECLHNITIDIGKSYMINKRGEHYLKIEVPEEKWNPFNKVILFGHYFCIGCGEYVYFVDLDRCMVKEEKQQLYFGRFYQYKDYLFITSATSVSCYDKECQLVWKSERIAIDGVLIQEIDEEKIVVLCEMDPPDKWVKRVLYYKEGLH